MNRWVVVALVGLALVIIVSPGIIGHLAERDLEHGIESARIESPEITISTERFNRGWFTSEGRHRIELSDRDVFPRLSRFVNGAGYGQMPAIIVESRIDHGLLPVAALGREDGSLAPGIASMRSTLQLDPGNGELIALPGSVTTRVAITGNTHMAIDLGEGQWSDGDADVRWGGADLDLIIDTSGEIRELVGYVEPLNVSSGFDSLTSARLDVNLEQEPDASGLTTGTIDLKSGGIVTRDEFGGELGFSAFSIKGGNAVSSGNFSGQSEIIINGISVPGLGLIDIDMAVSMKDVDAATLAPLLVMYEEVARDSGSEEALAFIHSNMQAEMQALIAAGGELQVERFDIMTERGMLETDIRMMLPESGAGDAFSWPGLLLKLEATLNVRMPAELFELFREMNPDVNSAVATGFLVPDGDGYKMHVDVDGGMAKVNGAPMSLPISEL